MKQTLCLPAVRAIIPLICELVNKLYVQINLPMKGAIDNELIHFKRCDHVKHRNIHVEGLFCKKILHLVGAVHLSHLRF